MKLHRFLVLIIIFLIKINPTQAAPITWSFTGIVCCTFDSGPAPLIGQTIIGSLTVDPERFNQFYTDGININQGWVISSTAASGIYGYFSLSGGLHVVLGGGNIETARIEVTKNLLGYNHYGVAANSWGSAFGPLSQIYLSATDMNGLGLGVFKNNSQNDLSLNQSVNWSYRFNEQSKGDVSNIMMQGFDPYGIYLTSVSVSSVPDLNTLVSMLSGLIFLVWRLRRMRPGARAQII